MPSVFVKLPVASGGGGGGAVDSFNGRTGSVVSQAGDYSASIVSNTPSGNISATNVQNAINELDTEKQAEISGSNQKIVTKNSSGVVESFETLNTTPDGGLNQNITDDVTDTDSHSVNYHYLG